MKYLEWICENMDKSFAVLPVDRKRFGQDSFKLGDWEDCFTGAWLAKADSRLVLIVPVQGTDRMCKGDVPKWFSVEKILDGVISGKYVNQGFFDVDELFCKSLKRVWNALPYGDNICSCEEKFLRFAEYALTKGDSQYLTSTALKQIALWCCI